MKAYIIYHQDEAEKNAAFIDMFKKAGIKYNIFFEYISYDTYKNHPLPDFVINRTRDYKVSRWYEDRAVKVFHSSLITRIGNDKYKTISYLKRNLPGKILKTKWCPESRLFTSNELNAFYKEKKLIRDRYIIKSLNGHGGEEVFMVSDIKSQDKALNNLKEKDCIIQEVIDSDSNDIRVYVVGGKIYAAILRHGNNDFRSNFSLGGHVEEYIPDEYQKKYIQNFIDAFGDKELGMVGIDFILDRDNNLVFNELEEMAGSRMLYKCTDKDIVSDYVSWINSFCCTRL
ncbi:MAG: ATP-grasp domain-containing protein [Lachnospiraceae bacterium]|nr:ATP-grasp domain-containing protein [Lachnospiraceae bacterium]